MSSSILEEHRRYLADRPRLDAFRRAIASTVRPGDVVLDLGAGTGILGLMAARAGAARVYSVESSSLIDLTRRIASANGLADRFTFIRGSSTSVTLPEKVDVVVADQIGGFGFEAGLFEYFADARARLLAPEGRTIPRFVDLWAAPVERGDLAADVDFWSERRGGFDVSAVTETARNTAYPVHLEPGDLVAPPGLLLSADPGQPVQGPWVMRAAFEVTRPATLHGLAGWFSAELAPGVRVTNSPLDPMRIDRRNVFLPLDATAVEPGHRIELQMQVVPGQVLTSWAVEVLPPGRQPAPIASSSRSTWNGTLLSFEDLQRTRPGSVPRLSEHGQGRRTVLELCDGTRSLAEVEAEVRRRHPFLSSEREAQLFVADVLSRSATSPD